MTNKNVDYFAKDEALEEFILEQEQNVKSAIGIQMEFFSWAMSIDEPSEVIDLILDSMEEYYFDFPSIDEYFERREHNKIEGEIEEMIDEFNQKLKFAIWEYRSFLSDFLEITDDTKVIMMIDLLVYKSILAYVPWREKV